MDFLSKIKSLYKSAKAESPSAKLLMHVNQQLESLSEHMQERIESAASGREGVVESTFEYILQDCSGHELQTEWQDSDYITYDDIAKTAGYQLLMNNAQISGLVLTLTEEQIEEVDDEDRVRFIINLSGWKE